MAKFTVPKAGYDFTIPQKLPVPQDVRTAMFRQMGELTAGGDEFALIDGGLALHCVGGRCKKEERRGKAVNPLSSLGLIVLSGNKTEICKRLHALLTGEIEVVADESAQAAQPVQQEWQDEIIARTGSPLVTFWGERLPDSLQNVMINDLGRYFSTVLADVIVARDSRSADRPNALRRLGTGLMPLAFVLLVSHPEYKRKFMRYDRLFTSTDDTYRLPWNDYIEKAIALIPPEPRKIPDKDRTTDAARQPIADASSSASGTVARKGGDAWLPLLPPELNGINVGSFFSLDDVLQAVGNIGSNATPFVRNSNLKLFQDCDFALYAVFHIDRNPEKFEVYKHLILPRWDAWVEAARRALPRR